MRMHLQGKISFPHYQHFFSKFNSSTLMTGLTTCSLMTFVHFKSSPGSRPGYRGISRDLSISISRTVNAMMIHISGNYYILRPKFYLRENEPETYNDFEFLHSFV